MLAVWRASYAVWIRIAAPCPAQDRGCAGRAPKPGDIPIEQATKFKLVVNLKTAKALGVQIPNKMLAVADEVIE